jgi:hypothetical protein
MSATNASFDLSANVKEQDILPMQAENHIFQLRPELFQPRGFANFDVIYNQGFQIHLTVVNLNRE